MPGAHDSLLSQWPALDVGARRLRLQDAWHVYPGTLVDALTNHRRTVDAAAAGLWRRDPSLWSDDPATRQKIANRLGWLVSPLLMAESLERLRTFASGIQREGFPQQAQCFRPGCDPQPPFHVTDRPGAHPRTLGQRFLAKICTKTECPNRVREIRG